MNLELRAYKYRIYPNALQREYFAKTFGCVRFIYNKMLSDRINHYENTGESLNNTPAQYKDEYPWLREVDSLALANAQLNLNKAYKAFFRDKSMGFPVYKSKKSNRFAYTTNNQKGTVDIIDGKLKLPKLKSFVRMKQHRTFTGIIRSCTVTLTPSGRYYASVLVEEIIESLPAVDTTVGVDLGIKSFAVCSDGSVYDNPRHLRRSKKRLVKLQRDLSRKQRGSNNRKKAKDKVARLHEKISNQRKDFLHKVSSKLISENQAIVIEDLKVKNMLKHKRLSKSISEVSWSIFRSLLEYKSKWYGRELIVAPANYASSQLCSICGYKHSAVKDLKLRQWTCPQCSTEHDRDMNAAHNLLKLALQSA